MLHTARAVAILLALSVAGITAAFLSLVDGVSSLGVLVSFLVAGAATYLLSFITLEFFIFREINHIHEVLHKLKKKDLSFLQEASAKDTRNPLRRINQEIFNFAGLKQREIEELKRMADFRREFLADVSHELKTPIFAAQGYIYTLLDGAADDEAVRTRFLQKAANSLDGLDVLVQDLLMLSQLETKQIRMYYSYFNLAELIRAVFDQMEGKAESQGIALRLPADFPEQLWVWADKQRIQQVITNLTSNAIKYSNDSPEGGGWVEAQVREEGDRIRVLIKDNGRGIPAEHLNRIFERFYRVEKSRAKVSGGTGLGLAIVKHILEAHKSQIDVQSEVGKGSVFSFRLKKRKDKRSRSQQTELAE
ncbi:sensor histidine kinase [Cesiribacter andamanensis]|uniref:histidine kinase n=1 Tax=Cesiribacter andamanensis AMV16 TaxID=1279009 RepID=M7N890_9BACT|nr:ATP-binding protein [Cesiribacter andamanensis]EMR03431.1 Alkaline phosphatase synthesis sensor protein phoR [Cesiribacter andamanensis AMV16]